MKARAPFDVPTLQGYRPWFTTDWCSVVLCEKCLAVQYIGAGAAEMQRLGLPVSSRPAAGVFCCHCGTGIKATHVRYRSDSWDRLKHEEGVGVVARYTKPHFLWWSPVSWFKKGEWEVREEDQHKLTAIVSDAPNVSDAAA